MQLQNKLRQTWPLPNKLLLMQKLLNRLLP